MMPLNLLPLGKTGKIKKLSLSGMIQRRLLLGDEAVAQGAVDAGISGVYAYPGTPSTEITESVVQYEDVYVEEKDARDKYDTLMKAGKKKEADEISEKIIKHLASDFYKKKQKNIFRSFFLCFSPAAPSKRLDSFRLDFLTLISIAVPINLLKYFFQVHHFRQ